MPGPRRVGLTPDERFDRVLHDIGVLIEESSPEHAAWFEKQRSRWWAYGAMVRTLRRVGVVGPSQRPRPAGSPIASRPQLTGAKQG